MRIAYFDCSSGISGDMTLGALLDTGIDLAKIQAGIDSLGLPSCQLASEEVRRKGFRATKLHVHHEPEHAHRHLRQITELIDQSRLTESQRELARRIFTRLGEAEAKVHGTTVQKVHFHEVGAVDSIADIVGTAIGLDLLEVDRIVFSPIPTGSGHVVIAHGRVGVPAPATAELLKNCPLAESEIEAELTTPTGAAIVASVADQFGPIPAMTVRAVGIGAGSREFPDQANVLRLFVGESNDPTRHDQVAVLETNLDDVTGEVVGHCMSLLFEAGALDVYSTAIQMKKNRPGTKVTVLCGAEAVPRVENILFRETGTLGIRRWVANRHALARKLISVDTRWGPVEGKLANSPEGESRFSPEFDSCRDVAARHGIPLNEVYQEAHNAFRRAEAVAEKPAPDSKS